MNDIKKLFALQYCKKKDIMLHFLYIYSKGLVIWMNYMEKVLKKDPVNIKEMIADLMNYPDGKEIAEKNGFSFEKKDEDGDYTLYYQGYPLDFDHINHNMHCKGSTFPMYVAIEDIGKDNGENPYDPKVQRIFWQNFVIELKAWIYDKPQDVRLTAMQDNKDGQYDIGSLRLQLGNQSFFIGQGYPSAYLSQGGALYSYNNALPPERGTEEALVESLSNFVDKNISNSVDKNVCDDVGEEVLAAVLKSYGAYAIKKLKESYYANIPTLLGMYRQQKADILVALEEEFNRRRRSYFAPIDEVMGELTDIYSEYQNQQMQEKLSKAGIDDSEEYTGSHKKIY